MNLTNHNMPRAKYVSIIMIIVNDINVILLMKYSNTLNNLFLE